MQAAGIRFIAFRNEQAAGYAAAASGFLTGVPGVLLTVSGPGAVHGIAGLSHAQVNTWPMLMISGSAEQARPRGMVLALRPWPAKISTECAYLCGFPAGYRSKHVLLLTLAASTRRPCRLGQSFPMPQPLMPASPPGPPR